VQTLVLAFFLLAWGIPAAGEGLNIFLINAGWFVHCRSSSQPAASRLVSSTRQFSLGRRSRDFDNVLMTTTLSQQTRGVAVVLVLVWRSYWRSQRSTGDRGKTAGNSRAVTLAVLIIHLMVWRF